MPANAWAVAAWGKGATDPEEEAPQLKEGEEECVICLERAEQVTFQPCKHGACHICVDKLRAANIFKVILLLLCDWRRGLLSELSAIASQCRA